MDSENKSIKVENFSIDFVYREGCKVIDNCRSTTCLQLANIHDSKWSLINRTGIVMHEERVDEKLRYNNLPPTGTTTIKY